MIIAFIALVAGSLSSCYSDEGNYDYKTEEEAGIIKIDTVGIANRLALSYNLNPGDHIEFEPNVTYSHPERLRYRWFVLTLTQGATNQCRMATSWNILLPTPSAMPRNSTGPSI